MENPIDQIKRVKKPKSVHDLGAVDIERLVAAVKAMPEPFWEHEDSAKENAFRCFHHTLHIIFRFVLKQDDPRNYHSKALWPVWRSLLMPAIEQAIAPYGFVEPLFPKVMLARLVAHGHIDRHRDGAGTNLYTHKIHIPLITNDGALFEAGGELVHLERGRAYEVNNIDRHAAQNDGDEDRIHLIFEVFEGAGLPRLETQESAAA